MDPFERVKRVMDASPVNDWGGRLPTVPQPRTTTRSSTATGGVVEIPQETVQTLMGLADVLASTPTHGATLQYDDTIGKWIVVNTHLEAVVHDFGSGLEAVTDDAGDPLYAPFG